MEPIDSTTKLIEEVTKDFNSLVDKVARMVVNHYGYPNNVIIESHPLKIVFTVDGIPIALIEKSFDQTDFKFTFTVRVSKFLGEFK